MSTESTDEVDILILIWFNNNFFWKSAKIDKCHLNMPGVGGGTMSIESEVNISILI